MNTMEKMTVGIIIFDLDDTLYDIAIPFFKALKRVYGDRINEISEKQFIDFRRFSDKRFEESRNGSITMDEMYIYRIEKTLEKMGISTTKKEALYFQKVYTACQGSIELTSTMRGILSWCQTHNIFMAIISNGDVEHQMNKVHTLGLLEYIPKERIFFSDAMEHAKPDKRIFLQVADILNLKNENIYYIGDSFENDVVGPTKAGWKTVWFNRRGYQLPKEPIPNFVARTERDLFNIIRKL